MVMTAGQFVQLFESVEAKRFNWDTIWQDVKDINLPEDKDFLVTRTPGERRSHRQFDMTGSLALEKFSAAMESMLTPRQQRFHILKPSLPELEKEQSVSLYFEELTNLLFRLRNRPQSGFYDQMHEAWKSLGAYGNQCTHVDKLPPAMGGGLSYRTIHISSVWIELNSRGLVDTIFYKFKMTAHQAMQKWGPERSPKSVHDRIKNGKEFDELEFLHIVKPREKVIPDRIGPESMPWESWEIALKEREFIPWQAFPGAELQESGGFFTMPYIYSRFTTNPSEKHGRGPAMIVLSDNMQLQSMERSSTIAQQIASEPPLLAMDDDLWGDATADLDLRPSAVNAGWLDTNGNPKVKSLESGFKFQMSEESKDQKRKIINDAHLVTLFQILVDTPQMTATEALLRAQEKGMLIAPVVGRQHSEALGRIIVREIDLIQDLRIGPEIPPILAEAAGEFEIEYASTATRLQREEEVQAILATYQDMGLIAQADPTVFEKIDSPGAVDFIAEARGVPPHLIRDQEAFRAILAAQQQAAQGQGMAEQLPGLAKGLKDLNEAGIDLDQVGAAVNDQLGGGGIAA